MVIIRMMIVVEFIIHSPVLLIISYAQGDKTEEIENFSTINDERDSIM